MPLKYHVKPWAHQLHAIELANMPEHKDLALFWEMGTGKTATTVNILRYRYASAGCVKRTLILAPIVVLENWREELKTHADMANKFITVLNHKTGKAKLKAMRERISESPSGIVVANYETLNNLDLFNAFMHWKLEILVCDESQRLKNHQSKRAKLTYQLSKSCSHRYLLSGTPILNSAMDIFMQFKILDNGQTFGENYFAFRNEYFVDKNAHMPRDKHFPDFVPKKGSYQKFSELMSRKSLRAKKSECLDLPPFVRKTIRVELTAPQRKAYKEMRDDFVTYLKGEKEDKDQAVVATLAITKGLRLQQIVSGFAATDDGLEVQFDKSPRLAALKELLEDLTPTNKVIIWACFKNNYKQIEKLLSELKIGYSQLTGATKDRDKELKAFRTNDKVRVMLANPQSAGLGVNLIEANYAIYFSKNFSLENDTQSEARCHRGGSEIHEKITRIDLVATDTIDEQVNAALRAKQNIADLILDWKL